QRLDAGLHRIALGEGALQLLPLAHRIGVQTVVQRRGEDQAFVVAAEERVPKLGRQAGPPLRVDLMLVDAPKHCTPVGWEESRSSLHLLPLLSTESENTGLPSRRQEASGDGRQKQAYRRSAEADRVATLVGHLLSDGLLELSRVARFREAKRATRSRSAVGSPPLAAAQMTLRARSKALGCARKWRALVNG